MQLKYGLHDRPPLLEIIIYGLQWFAVAIPIIIVFGKISGSFHFSSVGNQMIYLQKLTFVMGAALLVQLLVGHRMPLIIGPSSILLVGIIASTGFPADTLYTSVLCGGVVLVIAALTGLLGYLRKLFTPRIVAVVLILIAFTLAPTILNLISAGVHKIGYTPQICFALGMIFAMFLALRFFSGVWKSTLIIWAMIGGSLFWFFFFPGTFQTEQFAYTSPISGFFKHMIITPSFNLGVMISFLVCFLALAINDLGSIQSMNELLKPENPGGRINQGILVTGFSNILAGFLGVIGPVNYSLSPGVIAASGCAARITMLPTALLFLILSFSPFLIGFLACVPSVVIGAVMIYILSSQIAAGLVLIFESTREFRLKDGLIIGLPLILGTVIAFLPTAILNEVPSFVRPILGNGFVVGITAALAMEHLIFKD
jgi:xanthine/uracil permease